MKKLNGDANGRVQSLTTVQIGWQKNANGQFVPVEVADSENEIPADLVLLAMGFLGPEQPLLKDLGIQTDARSNIVAEHGRFTTNVKGVFTAGDVRAGASNRVAGAVGDGALAVRFAHDVLAG